MKLKKWEGIGLKSPVTVNIPFLLQGLFVTFMLMFSFSIVLAIVTVVSDWEETAGILSLFNYLSILIGAGYLGKRCQSKFWLHGALVGVGYLLILTLLRADLSTMIQWAWIKQLLITAIVGMVGGLFGGVSGS